MEEISKEFKSELQIVRSMLKERMKLLDTSKVISKVMALQLAEEQRKPRNDESEEGNNSPDECGEQGPLPKDIKGFKIETLATETTNKRDKAPKTNKKRSRKGGGKHG
uniref:Uncharacterized protein n=1 Tax=Micrurus paraensis TaxID=1970185 RepID=A0A2D4K056_9SAUR